MPSTVTVFDLDTYLWLLVSWPISIHELLEEAITFLKARNKATAACLRGAATSGHYLLLCELLLCSQSASKVLITVNAQSNFRERLVEKAWS